MILSKFSTNDNIEGNASGFSTELSHLKKLFYNIKSEALQWDQNQKKKEIKNSAYIALIDGFSKATNHDDISCLSLASIESLLLNSNEHFLFVTTNEISLLKAKEKYSIIENLVIGAPNGELADSKNSTTSRFYLSKWPSFTNFQFPTLQKTLMLNDVPEIFVKAYDEFREKLKPREKIMKIRAKEEEYIEKLKDCIKEMYEKSFKIEEKNLRYQEILKKYFK